MFQRHEPMSRHVSWKAGGMAESFYVPAHRQDLIDFVAGCQAQEPLYVVGLGSNLLVRDGGLKGTVVLTHGALKNLQVVEQDGHQLVVEAEAGVPAPKLARWVARAGFSGAEFLAGIPGTLGGALAMNAGCYGSETWQFVESVTTLDCTGQVHLRTPADYEVGYRKVGLLKTNPTADRLPLEPMTEWFLAARFRFPVGNADLALARIRELLSRRVATQPLGLPNAGSVFRNPEGHFAAQLIEQCQLKGLREGGAEVSTRHANFIINRDHATATDIENLIERVRLTVWERRGITLVPEVRIVGVH
jgi:UDP-N-acetylmuramate dehydrogenase